MRENPEIRMQNQSFQIGDPAPIAPFPLCTERNRTTIQSMLFLSVGVVMSQRKHAREYGMPSTQPASDHPWRALTSVEGIQPELQSLTSEVVPLSADTVRRTEPFVSEYNVELKDYSVSQEWHRPYVEALLETDGAKLGALIIEAERAIVGRFIELSISSIATNEFLDLQNAAYAVTELKIASAVFHTPQHLVA